MVRRRGPGGTEGSTVSREGEAGAATGGGLSLSGPGEGRSVSSTRPAGGVGLLEGRPGGLLEGRPGGLLEMRGGGLLEGRPGGLLEGREAASGGSPCGIATVLAKAVGDAAFRSALTSTVGLGRSGSVAAALAVAVAVAGSTTAVTLMTPRWVCG